MFRDTCILSKKDGFVLEWACRKLDQENGLHPGWAGGIVTVVLKRLHPRPPISLRLPFGEGLGTWNLGL